MQSQTDTFEALSGRTVLAWDGIEMALSERPPAGIQFSDPRVPFLQLVWVHLVLDNGSVIISTYQGDAWFGLQLSDSDPFGADDCSGIYRWRPLDLPTGRVGSVQVVVEEGTLSRIALDVGGRDLLLVAGEVYETWTDELEVHRLDESVLLFTDPADAQKVRWL